MRLAMSHLAAGALLLSGACQASTFLYTNSPCVYLIDSNGVAPSATLLGPTGTFSGSVTVPVYVKSSLFNVTAVAPVAFKGCGLSAFSLDASSKVAVIGEGAFWGCTNLMSVTLRASVTHLGASAFLGCGALASVNLSVATGLTEVADQVFSGCASLATLSLPGAVSRVGASAFRDCRALAALALPSDVQQVGDAAFQGCGALASVSLPGVTELGVNAFAGSGLGAVSLPAGLAAVGQGAFADCAGLTAVTYQGAPVELGSAAFKNCSALTQLPVPASVRRIASTAFDGCTSLAAASLPDGIVDLSDTLFANCSSLASLRLGAVTNVGSYACAGCGALTNVTFAGHAPEAAQSAFYASDEVFVYYYTGTAGWKNLLADRPTVMLGEDGSEAVLSFAAWSVRNGLASSSGLDDDSQSALFGAPSAALPGLANGSVYAFGDHLTAADQTSLLWIQMADDGTPVVVTPALAEGVENYVTMTVEGTAVLPAAQWDLPLASVALSDQTRAGFTPAVSAGETLPRQAFFRLRLDLDE